MSKPQFRLSNINLWEVGWLVARRMIVRLDMERLRLLRRSTLGQYVFLPHYRLVNRLRDMAQNFQLDCEWAMSDSLSFKGRNTVREDFYAGEAFRHHELTTVRHVRINDRVS